MSRRVWVSPVSPETLRRNYSYRPGLRAECPLCQAEPGDWCVAIERDGERTDRVSVYPHEARVQQASGQTVTLIAMSHLRS